MKNKKELHDKAWQLLEEKGLTMSERIMVRANFVEWSGYKEEYPFIGVDHNRGGKGIDFYYSEYDEIKSFRFETENEVILANAIYVNMLDENKQANVNDFIQIFKYTCRIIGIQSLWTK